MSRRNLSKLDQYLILLESVWAPAQQSSGRAYPAEKLPENGELTAAERRHAAGLMRVNHAGEMAAQGLYLGQAVTAQNPETQQQMRAASVEETDHLAWCKRRLTSLDAAPSRLDPFWFCGALGIGMLAGWLGDRWSLGFVAETEDQVVKHLEGHWGSLPERDLASRAVVEQMRADEAKHADAARGAGAAELPSPVQSLMRWTAKIMTKTAYYL